MQPILRREFLKKIAFGAAAGFVSGCAGLTPGERKPLNILLITADDMNYNALGTVGCPVPDITPHIDKFASEGVRYEHAHVTIAVCQPPRSVLMTGRYPHRNGALGFDPIDVATPTLQESLRDAGYLNGIFAKVPHLKPIEKFCWDTVIGAAKLGNGRSPELYYQHSVEFFQRAKSENRPFFLMANSQDPHRPFAGSAHEKAREKKGNPMPPASRYYKPEEIEVPGFLPDLPDVREEVAQYYSSVHRCDETVGEVLRALKESGLEDNTLVMFLSDNGMAFPFAKTNCYLTSTKTPWIVRWPGHTDTGRVDREHLISGIDFMPTVLDACGLAPDEDADGRSFVRLLEGKKQKDREQVFTVFNRTVARIDYPMRCIQTKRWGYLYNSWADDELVFKNESQSGLTFKAMQEGAETDPAVAERVKLFQYRVPQEFYDFENDPHALNNLIDDPAMRKRIQSMQQDLLTIMRETDDHLTPTFEEFLAESG